MRLGAPRDGPLPHIPALDRDHLEPALLGRMPPRHDRVRRVVGPPLAEQPAVGQPRAPARVERPAVGIKAKRLALAFALVGAALEHRRMVGCWRLRPAAALDGRIVGHKKDFMSTPSNNL